MRFVLTALLALGVLACDARAAGPDGLYLMTKIWGSSLTTEGWFFKGGQVSYLPRGDLDKFDFKAAAAAAPNATGAYKLAGDQMTIIWANGKQVAARFEAKDKGCFYFNGGLYCPAKAFGKGEKFDAVFSGGASAAGAASSRTITFTSNGQYKMDSAGSATSTSSRSTVMAGGWGSEAGTYELSGTKLVLKPTQGQPRQVLVFQYDDGTKGPQPRRMFFDGGMLQRKQ